MQNADCSAKCEGESAGNLAADRTDADGRRSGQALALDCLNRLAKERIPARRDSGSHESHPYSIPMYTSRSREFFEPLRRFFCGA
jgi:hypothetical protein